MAVEERDSPQSESASRASWLAEGIPRSTCLNMKGKTCFEELLPTDGTQDGAWRAGSHNGNIAQMQAAFSGLRAAVRARRCTVGAVGAQIRAFSSENPAMCARGRVRSGAGACAPTSAPNRAPLARRSMVRSSLPKPLCLLTAESHSPAAPREISVCRLRRSRPILLRVAGLV